MNHPIGLYLHIPFCDGKCAYCSFFSRRCDSDMMDDYSHHLKKAVRYWSKRCPRTVDTVYFGGGTPSLLGHERLSDLLNCIGASFCVTDGAEVTVEVNPTSADHLDLSALRKSGFNRLSIGMQSVNDRELQILERRHDSEAVRRTVLRAREAGFDNVSLDVMLAIPEQTRESLNKTLSFCAECGVEHVSCYMLKIEKGTRFFDRKDSLSLFSDDEQAAFYEQTVTTLSRLGFRQYEISNFSKPGFESRHNLHYWHDEEYLGIGPSAHSFLDGKRFFYEADFSSFYSGKIVNESVGGDSDEYIMLALRLTEGLVFERYHQRFRKPLDKSFIDAALALEEHGLCTVTDKSISLTTKGFLVSNSVIAHLLYQ